MVNAAIAVLVLCGIAVYQAPAFASGSTNAEQTCGKGKVYNVKLGKCVKK